MSLLSSTNWLTSAGETYEHYELGLIRILLTPTKVYESESTKYVLYPYIPLNEIPFSASIPLALWVSILKTSLVKSPY